MQGDSATTSGYHAAKADVGQTGDQMDEATIGALANLATATAADRGAVATLTEANSHLAKQLEDNSTELRELKALLKNKELKEEGRALLTLLQTINAGLMVKRWPPLTPV
jgi:hypothetical protein